MSSQVNYGLLAPLVGKPEKLADLEAFLVSGHALALEEPETKQWYAVKYEDPAGTYAIFDTFPTPHGRDAHLTGPIAAALGANVETLLSTGPEIAQIDILASHIKAPGGAHLKVGLRALITAKEGKEEDVKNFLLSAVPLVEAEKATPIWYAFRVTGTRTFGIVDFFADDEGRNSHVGGVIAAALFENAPVLLDGSPDIVKVDVLAAKVEL